MTINFKIDIETFDQDPNQGWRKFLPPPGDPSGPPTPAQFKQAGDAIWEYFDKNKNRGVSANKVEIWEFSLDFHAFQMYAQSDDKNKEEKMKYFLDRAVKRFDKIKNDEYLKNEYGPTVIPYLEATLIFINEKLSKEDKQKHLNEKLSEMLKVPISSYPEKNVAFFAGRVHDMAKNPELSYTDIFRMPPTFPPLQGMSEWIPIHSLAEHRAYVKVENKIKFGAENQDQKKTSALIMQFQTYIEQNKLEHQREEELSKKSLKQSADPENPKSKL